MTGLQIQLAWDKVISETHKRPKLGEKLKEEKISLLGDLFLFIQAFLGKIEAGENNGLNDMIFKKTMSFYCEQMKKYER